MNFKEISIDIIGLSVRTRNCLHHENINNVEEMMQCTRDSLFEIRNMGQKSVDEVLHKIEELKKAQAEEQTDGLEISEDNKIPAVPEDFAAFMKSDEGKTYILSWSKYNNYTIRDLELLSAKAYNRLLFNGFSSLGSVLFMSYGELLQIPRMDFQTADEIVIRCRQFLTQMKEDIINSIQTLNANAEQVKEANFWMMFHDSENKERILSFVKANDERTENLDLSKRAKNFLLREGKILISDFIFLTEKDLREMPSVGDKTIGEILGFIKEYLNKREARIVAVLNGDESVLWDDDSIRDKILETYNIIGFKGLSLREMREEAEISEQVGDEQLKRVIGRLLADGKLEYVDFRCYRVYPRFSDYLAQCTNVDERNKSIINRRLQGITLGEIASEYGMTRQRVLQIINGKLKIIISKYTLETGLKLFDEDYYRSFFETYSFDKKDAEEWFGIDSQTFAYLEMTGSKQGKKSLDEAADDYHNLNLGFRLKISNYLNRNRLFLDSQWIDKKRGDLEEYVIRKFCKENVSYDDFVRIYNDFLKEEEVSYDEDLYYTDAVKHSRENKLQADRFLLWKLGHQLRYYDIDRRDYTEFLDVLNLSAYENVEFSTLKFFRDYPELMEKYDIRDQYELHNLLRKIVHNDDYPDLHFEKMPTIRFGTFDRAGAMLDILVENAPISQMGLAELISQEYGYDVGTVIGTYLPSLSQYYHQGMYRIDQKAMLIDNQRLLLGLLTDDFYYIDEIRKIYMKNIPGADAEEINPYNLKLMGFYVLSRYAYRNHNTLEDYFREILTKDDITDITEYRKRFTYVQAFSGTFNEMKNNLEIFEFEPNQIITYSKLESAGVTIEDMHFFCDEVDSFVEQGRYFTVKSIKEEGFESSLFELGFSDWFYSNLLTSDDRFSNTRAFGNIILFKGNQNITACSFEESLICEHESIDVYDLMNEMEELYGCRISERLDLVYKVNGTEVYHDKYLDRLYANIGVFNRELDAAEGM